MFFACSPFDCTGCQGSARRSKIYMDKPACYKRRMQLQDYAPRSTQLKWLLDSDPAIRWQVMRDLTDEGSNAIAAARSRVATEGWGAQLLSSQSRAGNFGLAKEDRGLLTTLYSVVVVMELGLDPSSKQARIM